MTYIDDKITKAGRELIKDDTREAREYYEKYVGVVLKKTLPNGKEVDDAHNNDVDAFRHAYAAGVAAMKYGENIPNVLGQAYEIKNDWDNYRASEENRPSPQQVSKEKNMDLWNNKVGREI